MFAAAPLCDDNRNYYIRRLGYCRGKCPGSAIFPQNLHEQYWHEKIFATDVPGQLFAAANVPAWIFAAANGPARIFAAANS